MLTIEVKLRQWNGVVPGFDGLRLAAAFLVLASHAFPLTMGDNRQEPLSLITAGQLTGGSLAVTVFFAVSGFLIATSLSRSKGLTDFIWRRATRLLPALLVVVLLTVVVIGPIFTSLSAAEYLTQTETWAYLLNAAFFTKHTLPGVFTETPHSGVNGSLWTLRWEVASYIGLTCLSLTVLNRWRAAAPLSAAGSLVLSGLLTKFADIGPAMMLGDAAALFGAFMCGASLYLYRDRVPADLRIVAALILLLPFATMLGVLKLVAAPVVAYACLTVSLREWPRLPDDYSYGVYLWAFPVQQIMVATGVAVTWWTNIIFSGAITLLLAVLSWRLVEKPSLRWKSASVLLKARPEPSSRAPETPATVDGPRPD